MTTNATDPAAPDGAGRAPAADQTPTAPAPNAQPPASTGRDLSALADDDDAPEPGASGHVVPQHAFKDIKAKARASGQLALARKFGFSSVEELEAALAARAAPDADDEEPDAGDEEPYSAGSPLEDPNVELHEELDDEADDPGALRESLMARERALATVRRDARLAKRKAEAAHRELAATRIENELADVARNVGVRDTKFALFQLREHLKQLPRAQRAQFDAAAYFTELLTKHPTVGAVQPRPANTAPGSAAPGAPAPKPAPTPPQGGGRFNAKTATADQVKARITELYGNARRYG